MNDIRIVNQSNIDQGDIDETRRGVLKAGAVLSLAVFVPGAFSKSEAGIASGTLAPNAFVRIGADSRVTIVSKFIEMGQGTHTGIATLVAEELDADWSQIQMENAPADVKRYANLSFGMQGTGGSTAIAGSYEQYRQAGATARAMLVAAAAKQWGVPAEQITVSRGVVSHVASGRSSDFGKLVAQAAKLPVPAAVKLKDPSQFVYIGKPAIRTDALAKSNGTAIYTQDIQLPGMLTAVVAHAPRFGSKVKSFDASKARAIPGVVDVVEFSNPATNGVAVLARDFWTAKKGRDALSIEWDESAAFRKSSAELSAEYRRLAEQPGKPARNDGDVDAAFASAAKIVEASYEVPFLAHASMEPLNCVVRLGEGECEVWNGEQLQTLDQANIAKYLGLPPEKVKLNMLFAGGSFGRRGNPHADYMLEAVSIARAAGGKVPVKLVWSREEDTRAGYYRPMYFHKFKAGLDKDGRIIAWLHRVVGQSIVEGTPFAMMVRDGIDPMSVEGASNLPYDIPNLRVELHTPKVGVPVLFWRSVGSSHNAFTTECFMDEVARAANRDPVEMRRSLLARHPRHQGVLDLAAQKAGWGQSLPKDKARSVAVHESFNTYVAEVAEISRDGDSFRVEKVVCAVDCGVAVNPNIVAMQMESAIGFGLSAAMAGAITFKEGVVEQSNFHDYPVVRMNQMPQVEVHIVPSQEKPTGVGEPGVPPLAPALANGILALTGKPVRGLPLSAYGIQVG